MKVFLQRPATVLFLLCLFLSCHKGCSPFYEDDDVLREHGFVRLPEFLCPVELSRHVREFDVLEIKTRRLTRVLMCCGCNDNQCLVKEMLPITNPNGR